MSWKEIELGQAIHVKHGFAFKGEYFVDEGDLMVLTPGNFNEEGGFRVRPGKDRAYAGEVPDDYVLKENDLIVAMTEQGAGLLGSSALVPESNRYLHNQRIGLVDIIDEKLLDRDFLYFLFNTWEVRGQISGSASGTKVRHTAPERIYRVRVRVPEVTKQKVIAQTLKAYEDLIANNKRRIELLEYSARLLFKDWFVRLHYPGHEHDKKSDGLPQGWRRGPLGDFVKVGKGKNITRETVNPGNIPVVAGGLSYAYLHDTANAFGKNVTISASGANAGFVNFYQRDIWASDCSVISSTNCSNIHYVYLLLKTRQKDIFGMQHGAAQPHVYPKDIARLLVQFAPPRLIEEFEGNVSYSFDLIRNYENQNDKLARARNLLLPRAMHGRIAL